MEKIKNTFKSIDFNINNISELINKLNKIDDLCKSDIIDNSISISTYIHDLNTTYDKLEEQLNTNEEIIYEFLDYYIGNYDKIFHSEISIFTQKDIIHSNKIPEEKDVDSDIHSDNKLIDSNVNPKKTHVETQENRNTVSQKNILQDNNVLLISEKDNMVYLPYKISDIEKIFNENMYEYSNLQDVINKNYTISLSRFKNPVVARFRETFSLLKNKEHSSLPKALDLSLELAFNSLLNPAVICACSNLDELYIYLDYLETNELDKFHIFEVKYEMLPIAKKQ